MPTFGGVVERTCPILLLGLAFHSAMILPDDMVQMRALSNGDPGGVDPAVPQNRCGGDATLVNGDFAGHLWGPIALRKKV